MSKQKNDDELLDFLKVYLKDYEIKLETIDDGCRFLCENYEYDEYDDRRDLRIMMIAYGYFLAKSGCHAEANVKWFLLKQELDRMYRIVAKENNWETSKE